MKKLFFLPLFAALLGACGSGTDNSSNHPLVTQESGTQSTAANQPELTTVQWLDSVQNFGKVTEGEKVLISFHFRNTGDKPLVITNVTASCGASVHVFGLPVCHRVA